MANRNQVTLTFAGDSDSLDRTFDKVGSGARDMGRHADEGASGIDRLGEAGGNTETRFLGLGAGISGVGTLLSGDLNAETAAMAMADLGDAVEHTIAPLLAQGKELVANGAKAVASAGQHVASAAKVVAAWVLMGIQALANAAKMAVAWLISLGPIGLVIAAVGAVIGILVALGVGFDDIKRWAQIAWDFVLGIIKGVWNWISENWPLLLAIITGPIGLAVKFIIDHWEQIKAGFTAVKDWIAARIGDVVGFFTGMPGRITRAISGLWDGISSGFKSAINAVIRLWNNFEIKFAGFDIPGPGPNIPGFTISTPNIPLLASGGIVTRPTLAMLGEAGPEAVVPLNRMAGGQTIVHVHVAGSIRSDRDLVRMIKDELNRGGLR